MLKEPNRFQIWIKQHPEFAVALLFAAAAVILVIIVLLVFFPPQGEGAAVSDEAWMVEGTLLSSASDTFNDLVDPENTERSDDNGAIVNAADLTGESGRSHGIDVSKWQGKIDWKKVKKSGIEFAMIRIGYRGEDGIIYKDENADYNLQQADANGLLVGVYFFSTAISPVEAAQEADWTIRAIRGYPISYPVVYDCEGYLDPDSRMYDISPYDRAETAMVFLKQVKNAGYEPMLYGAAAELEDRSCWDLSVIASKYKIWVARYPTVTYPAISKPAYNGRIDAWQYTNKGSVQGVLGNVDMVVAYFERQKAKPKDSTAKPIVASSPATAEEKTYQKVEEQVTAKETTNLRTAPTTKSEVVATIHNGTFVTRIGIGTNGWSKLKYQGKMVYAITSYLTTEKKVASASSDSNEGKDSFEPVKETVTAKEKTNLRAAPSTTAKLVYTLKNGETVRRVGIDRAGGWSKLEYKGQTVYAITSFLTTNLTPVSSSPPTPSDGFELVDETVTAKEITNLRAAPSTTAELVYTLKNGETVRRIGIHRAGGWSKLEYKGQIVYAITSYLTTDLSPASSESSVKTTQEG